MLRTALSRRRFSRGTAIAAVAAGALTGAAVSACASGNSATANSSGTSALSDTSGPSDTSGGGARDVAYIVRLERARFAPVQHLAQSSDLVLAVRNVGTATLPNVAVTITDPPYGTAAQAFSRLIAAQPGLASRSRPVWIIDRPPGPCGFGCRAGGPGGAVTAYANTWALGPLAPGRVAVFDWTVTAAAPGRWVVAYRIAAELQPAAAAVLADGRPAIGRFGVRIVRAPRSEYVTASGQVVYGP